VTDENKTGVCPELTLAEKRLVRKHTMNHVNRDVGNGLRNMDLTYYFFGGHEAHKTKTVEHFRQGIAIEACRANWQLAAKFQSVMDYTEPCILFQWRTWEPALKPITKYHLTSPPEAMTGIHHPFVSKRSDLTPPPEVVQAALKVSQVPFVWDHELCDFFWKIRSTVELIESDDAMVRFSGQESLMPYRLKEMSGKLGTDPYYLPMSIMCWVFRLYARCGGTMHWMYDRVSRACTSHAEPLFIDRPHWEFLKKKLKAEYAGKRTLREWVNVVHKDGADLLRSRAIQPDEFSWAVEYVRLEALPAKQRYSAKFLEFDTAGSGPLIIKILMGVVQCISDINVRDKNWIHPRLIWLSTIVAEKIPNFSVQDQALVLSLLKAMFSPKSYGAGAWPLFDVLVGVEGKRNGFKDFKEVRLHPICNHLKDGTPEDAYKAVVTLAKTLSKSFAKAFPDITRFINKQLKWWKDTPWNERWLGEGVLMSPYKDDMGPEPELGGSIEDREKPRKVVLAYHCDIVDRERELTCMVDPIRVDDRGTSTPGRKAHDEDKTQNALNVLVSSGEIKAPGDTVPRDHDILTLHDASGVRSGEATEVLECDSLAFAMTYPKVTRQVGWDPKVHCIKH